MNIKKTLLVFCIIMCILFTVSSVTAGDANDTAISSEDQDLNGIENQDSADANVATAEVDNENNIKSDVISSSNEDILSAKDNGTFTELQEKINNASEGSTITLENDYIYDEGFSTMGITIYKPLTIDGKGYTINGNSQSRIFIIGNNIVLKNINFKNGLSSNYGGAIYSSGDNCNIISCTFTNCSSSSNNYAGGAIYTDGSNCNLISCNFINCLASSGGAIVNIWDCNINSCNFINCSASKFGGAIRNNGYGCNIISCNFTDCSSSRKEGGAISDSGGNCNIRSCTFTNCSSSRSNGGAIYSSGVNFNLISCNFSDCTASSGGAIYNSGDNCSISSCDFANCSASSGGAIYNNGVNCIISSCDFANCSASSGGAIYNNAGGNCIISSCDFANCYADYDGGAIYNMGDNCIVSSCNFTDCYTDYCKLSCWGAVGGYNHVIKNCTYKDSNVPEGNKFINLQNLIDEAEPGSTITLEKDYVYGGSDREMKIYKPLTIDGNNHIINANSNSGIFATDCDNVVLKNIAFTGGVSRAGGAISNEGDNCSVVSCNFTNCRASDCGGAVFNWGNNFTMKSCNFKSCSATSIGGAFDSEGGNFSIISCNFIKCTASQIGGGAISIISGNEGIKSIESCNFINCSARDFGGAIRGYTSNNIKISSCNFKNCRATGTYDGFGGAIAIDECEDCSILYCNFIKCYTAKINTTIDGAIYINNCNVTVKNCTYNDSDASDKIKTIIVSSPVTTVYNGNKYLVATLKDGYGNALSGFEVSVDLNGVKKLTDKNGQVKVSTNGLTPKTYNVLITFAGNENYTASNTTTKVVINKDSTKLTASAVTTVYNVNKNLVITLKDSQGKGLNSVKVSVNINGAKTYTTDKNGQIKIAVGSLVPKAYTAKISFAGNNYYKASSANAKVTVNKATPKLTAKAQECKKSVKTKKYSVTLKTNQNKVMKNVKLTLKVNGKTYSAKTNAKGQATFKITKLTKKGKYTAVVKFAGSKYYNAKTAKPKITIK